MHYGLRDFHCGLRIHGDCGLREALILQSPFIRSPQWQSLNPQVSAVRNHTEGRPLLNSEEGGGLDVE